MQKNVDGSEALSHALLCSQLSSHTQHKHPDPTLQADDQKYILWGK